MAIKFDQFLEALDPSLDEYLDESLIEGFWDSGKEFNEFISLLNTEFDNSEWNNWNQARRDRFAEKVAKRYLEINPTPTPMFFQDLTDNNYHTERRAFERLLDKSSLTESLNEALNKYTFGQDFEKHIPHNMRYKEYDFIKDNGQNILYWITQDTFDDSDIKKFKNALYNKTDFDGAFVILRDDSSYSYNKDKNSGKGSFIENRFTKVYVDESLNESKSSEALLTEIGDRIASGLRQEGFDSSFDYPGLSVMNTSYGIHIVNMPSISVEDENGKQILIAPINTHDNSTEAVSKIVKIISKSMRK